MALGELESLSNRLWTRRDVGRKPTICAAYTKLIMSLFRSKSSSSFIARVVSRKVQSIRHNIELPKPKLALDLPKICR